MRAGRDDIFGPFVVLQINKDIGMTVGSQFSAVYVKLRPTVTPSNVQVCH